MGNRLELLQLKCGKSMMVPRKQKNLLAAVDKKMEIEPTEYTIQIVEATRQALMYLMRDALEEMTLNEIWETLHASGYKIGDVETMYAQWVYHNVK